MPCKGDECCSTESGTREFESPTKSSTVFVVADTSVTLSSSASSTDQPVCLPKSPVNGHTHGDPNQTSSIDRRHHLSGIPFQAVSPLAGEELKSDGVVDLSNCRAFLSNYRIVIVTHNRHGACSIPLMGVDNVEAFDEMLKILCKDGRVFSISANNQETAMNWYKTVTPIVCGARHLSEVFAFRFALAASKHRPAYLRKSSPADDSWTLTEREFTNCRFKPEEWRISKVNEDFKVCASYPRYLVVPTKTSDDELRDLKRGRFFDRFPTAVWRAKSTGAVLLRSSQPEVSFFGTPQEGDIKLFDAIKNVVLTEKKRKIMIIDARSYTAAWANRAKGGGFESGESYNGAEVVFMSLPNIHSLRYSFHQLRQLLNSNVDGNSYFQALSASQWFQYLFNLIISSQRCVEMLCVEGVAVLVHCSDGWDRTAQIISLTKLIADSYYRTFDGFEHLIRREWCEFGHKFNDRNGVTSTDTNERSPVFMQFLDAVHQLWLRNPDMFEFNQRYLMKLAQHQYSGMFGTFLFNNFRELVSSSGVESEGEDSTQPKLISVFDYLNKQNPSFGNPVFDSRKTSRLVCPKAMWELAVWREVFCCSDLEEIVNNPNTAFHPTAAGESPPHAESTFVEKLASTMSRSQSAASLNSLDQLTANGIHTNGTINHSTQNGNFPVGSSYSTISYVSSRRELHELPTRTYVDVDGLSKVPIEYEDRILKLQNQSTNLDQSARSSSESSMSRESKREVEVPHQVVVRRHRVESNDSSMFSFEVIEEAEIGNGGGRRKRDSCSSNVLIELCPPTTRSSDLLISALNEEETARCEHCQIDVPEQTARSESPRKSDDRLLCDRCSDRPIARRANGEVVVS